MKSVIFDLDGTLTDSGEGIMNCAAEALGQLGLPIPPRQDMRVFVGPPLADTFIHFGVPPEQTAEAIRIFRARYTTIGKYENIPYMGVEEMLQHLLDRGYVLYVATSKPEPMAVDILNHFHLAQYFRMICGATLDSTRITKDQVLSYLLELTGKPENAVMVGDTIYDIMGAAAHSIPAIGVTWGYGSEQEMKQAGAVGIAHSMQELLTLL